MTSDIQFGELEQSEPQRELRPDQDAHFSVAEIGEINPDDLRIYVDLDVMRDMEAHAQSNTRVELGGVMLGQQHVDEEGIPFVVITDSLRARHYEATKGSFKFTHDTWSQITDEREEFRPDLEMVGWYHTHPGWSVFLSGMDLFICNNFFNRPLDVALVIDPCNDDRGWFQWTRDARPVTVRTGGFYLTTGRFRHKELMRFARIYNKEPIPMNDPRYGSEIYSGGSQPVVNLIDNRKPVFELAVVGMLLVQFLVFAAMGWKLLAPAGFGTSESEQVAELQDKLAELQATRLQQTREQVQSDVLSAIVAGQTGQPEFVNQLTESQTEIMQLQSNIEAQMALSEKLARENRMLLEQVKVRDDSLDRLNREFQETKMGLEAANAKLKSLDHSDATGLAGYQFSWWWLPIVGLVTAVVGAFLGFSLGKSEHREILDDYPDAADQRGAMATFEADQTEPSPPADDGSREQPVKIVDREFEGRGDE